MLEIVSEKIANLRESQKQWKQKNKDKVQAYQQKWNDEHQGYQKEWSKAHPERKKEPAYVIKAREWRKAYKERHIEETRIERRNASTKRRARKQGISGGHFTAKEFKELCNVYGNKCLCCKREDIRLTADHVIPLIMKIDYSDEISNIQPLCQSCNSKKGTKIIDYRKQNLHSQMS